MLKTTKLYDKIKQAYIKNNPTKGEKLMIYKLEKSNYKNFKVFKDNVEPSRSYFIPFASRKKLERTDIRNMRYNSDIVSCLSGQWDFKFYKHISSVPDSLNTSRTKFDEITVPCDWQRTGYQEPVYLNCPYEFKTMYPDVPDDQPAAVYRKKFNISDVNRKYIISFLGVATNMELYVNGRYIGYSEGTHNTAEFDITDCIKEGENELVLFMAKWCCGSFLEAQDMFRENGIIRDVLLYSLNKDNYIYDYHVRYKKTDNGNYDLTLDINVPSFGESSVVSAELKDPETGDILAQSGTHAQVNTKFEFKNLSVKEWNAEIPKLYELYISLSDSEGEIENIRENVGFRTISVEGDLFKFNGKLIKFKGFDHHDTNPVRGYAMTLRDMERDVAIFKQYNANSVRTSHYPPDPYFLELCDLYGIYVIDEADIETHGLNELTGDFSDISDDLRWQHHYVDRVDRMYERDKNRVSVTMWSLGNESGGYRCQDKCYEALKAKGTEIPVHYESVIHSPRICYDLVSEMYTDLPTLERVGQHIYPGRKENAKKRGWSAKIKKNSAVLYNEKPFFLCEYAHAMGFGPGALEDYWKIIYKYDNLIGGCIWEFADHAVYHFEDKYKFKYTYGGDHKEKQHDGNFCVDALFYPDRKPHTGALLARNVYRPLRASVDETGLISLTNTNRFKNSDYLTVKYIITQDGEEKCSGILKQDVGPCETKTYSVKEADELRKADADVMIRFLYFDGAEFVADEQLSLSAKNRFDSDILYNAKFNTDGTVKHYVSGGNDIIETGDTKFTFDSDKSRLVSVMKNGREYLSGDDSFDLNFTRAPLDNDCNIKTNWKKLGLFNLNYKADKLSVNLKDGLACVSSSFSVIAAGKTLGRFIAQYDIDSKGILTVNISSYNPLNFEPARTGVKLTLPGDFSFIKYLGLGPYENLPDMTAHCYSGIFSTNVADMHENYEFPQENGTRTKVENLVVSSSDGRKIEISSDDKFIFCAHDYSEQSLEKANHPEQIERDGLTHLCLDSRVRGSGTASCGPETLDKYKIMSPFDFRVSFTFKFE